MFNIDSISYCDLTEQVKTHIKVPFDYAKSMHYTYQWEDGAGMRRFDPCTPYIIRAKTVNPETETDLHKFFATVLQELNGRHRILASLSPVLVLGLRLCDENQWVIGSYLAREVRRKGFKMEDDDEARYLRNETPYAAPVGGNARVLWTKDCIIRQANLEVSCK